MLTKYNHFKNVFDLSKDIFDLSFEPFSKAWVPKSDIEEDEKQITISAEIPGVEPEKVQINLDGNLLSISGEREVKRENDGKHFYRCERSSGSFKRSFMLPETAVVEAIDAAFENGILTVSIPKKALEEVKKQIKITVKK
jgi:HSP20 family protein